ncbi:hypothetical protein F2S72_09225 [Pseudomonas syringae pv. actinidiae]|nr:hypothetical protein [Pseudomonas syringae pv. actinidiae]
MTTKVSAVALGASLLFATVVLAVVSLQSVTSMTHAVFQAAIKAPDSPAYDSLIVSWADLMLPLLLCLTTAVVVFLLGSILAFRGELTISYRKPHQSAPL